MSFRILAASLAIIATLGLSGVAMAQDERRPADKAQSKEAAPSGSAKTAKAKGKSAKTTKTKGKSTKAVVPEPKAEEAADEPRPEKATFGGGCFWCLEAVFERVPGVKYVVSGYAGGTSAKPDLRHGLHRPDRARRGRPDRVRSRGRHLRQAARRLLASPRPDHA